MSVYYQRAGITLYLGRCEEILPDLEAPDLVLADPPYGVGIARTKRARWRGGRGRREGTQRQLQGGAAASRDWPEVVGDRTPFDPTPYLVFPKVILWGANHYADRLPPRGCWLVWDKRCGTGTDFNADCELAWTNLPGVARLYPHLWRGLCRDSEVGVGPLHPTQKPVALMAWCIERAALAPGSLVLDPYAGSGPTLVAAKAAGHRAIGVEVEERYCEVIARRLDQDVLPLFEAEAAG